MKRCCQRGTTGLYSYSRLREESELLQGVRVAYGLLTKLLLVLILLLLLLEG